MTIAASDAVQTSSPLFATVATNADAIAHFRARLAFESDVSDVHAALEAGDAGFVLVDTRSDASWAQGRVPGAVHLPTRRIADEASGLIGPGTPVVVYCWGPGCNGAQRAALEFALLGHPVKEMLGGFEYWVREGFAVESDEGRTRALPDPLTNVSSQALPSGGEAAGPISCAC
ncbi:rhodanese-like domain-containing protein [Agromyces protaetiae]|uniref:Rhodanese-like domain-containing protein n=1 Tax=Agromyces protaetiae TaxID=2509455 RepID=A0A4P6FCJ1_9MICO|nr:rhodanese-like domain-containing protein [Agromyces protaetiae]QAY73376.1 rhodanese-like domain-containing protein [Agromyces protaetiae]